MSKAAIYCRVSSDEQAEKGTIEGQVQYAERYLELHGPESDITEYEFYLDEGVSGVLPLLDRPAGARLISDAKNGKFQALFVYRLDRLARSTKHVLDTYELLEKCGISVKSMTESFDTSTPTGKFFMTLLASIAALERDTIMGRTQMGKERNIRQGKWVSGAPPFGYRIGEDGKLFAFESEAETIRLIFSLYNEGMSMVEIAKYLNAKNAMTPAQSKGSKGKSTGKWHAGHVSIVLRSGAYTGVYEHLTRSKRERETIEAEVPVIIERELFDKMQKRIDINADVARGKKGRNYLLRGLIFCGDCGRAMVGTTGSSKEGRVYYRCGGATDQGQGKQCNAKLLRATDAENAVWEDIKEFLYHPERFRKYIDDELRGNTELISSTQEELNEIEKAILGKQIGRGKVLSLIARGITSDLEAETTLKELATEISSLNSRKEFLFDKLNTSQQFESIAIDSQLIFDTLANRLNILSDQDKADIVNAFVRRVDVFTKEEDGKKSSEVRIHYKFSRGTELGISGDSQLNTTVYSIESTWEFQAFSRKGGSRIKWR